MDTRGFLSDNPELEVKIAKFMQEVRIFCKFVIFRYTVAKINQNMKKISVPDILIKNIDFC